MASRGDTVYVLRTWETDGYGVWDRNLEVFLSEYDAKVRGTYLQESFYLKNNKTDEFVKFHFSVVGKELS